MYYKPHIKFVVAHSKGKMAKCLEMEEKYTVDEKRNDKKRKNKSEKDKKKHAYTQDKKKTNKNEKK